MSEGYGVGEKRVGGLVYRGESLVGMRSGIRSILISMEQLIVIESDALESRGPVLASEDRSNKRCEGSLKASLSEYTKFSSST